MQCPCPYMAHRLSPNGLERVPRQNTLLFLQSPFHGSVGFSIRQVNFSTQQDFLTLLKDRVAPPKNISN
ncbi:hypothetical protein F9C07_12534 [Aspergillus flavus]|uniref:Uncharacterized protein n=1 Tax=Aspergillus flavus (strain ATCC 200026 / FGSC A1120 / IAM 13836 / NRRL 3357 / JCM 12722 / SRRC 167) TaxID=332952 RepID=A0A7U2MZ78_ASPFN|nr:hypothetical protein F9C07_12534 [Aspergillus flavus]